MKKYTTMHMVKMEDLNHHQTLYAGRAAEWLMEAAFQIGSLEYGIPEGVVYRNTHSFEIMKPFVAGDIVTYEGLIVRVGRTSFTMYIRLKNQRTGEYQAEAYVTFVTVDPESKTAVAHGITLDCIESSKELQWRTTADKFFRR